MALMHFHHGLLRTRTLLRRASPVKAALMSTIGPDNRYPIWFLPKDGSAYDFVYKTAENSSAAIQTLHDVSGLPWWVTIIATGFLVRGSLLPLAIIALRNAAKAAVAGERVRAVEVAFQRALATSKATRAPLETLQLYLTLQRGVWAAQRRSGCRPWLSFTLPFLQIPLLFAAVLGARHSVLMGDDSFEREGLLWFTDLSVHDPYYIVPAAAMALGYVSLEVMLPRRVAAPKPILNAAAFGTPNFTQMVRNAGQMSLLAMIPFVADLPAGMFLLMSANSAWTIAYLSLIRSPAVHGYLLSGLPLPERSGGGDVGSGNGAVAISNDTASGTSTVTPSREAQPSVAWPATGSPMVPTGRVLAPVLTPVADRSAPARGTHTSAHTSQSDGVNPITDETVRSPPGCTPRMPLVHLSRAPVTDTSSSVGNAAWQVPAELVTFAHHLQMHPRFLYHADGPVDLDKEATYITRIRSSFQKDMPWLAGAANPFALAVAGGDKRMPWFTSPVYRQDTTIPRPAVPTTKREESSSRAWYASVWQGGVTVPAAALRPSERMRVNPRLFTSDVQGGRLDTTSVPITSGRERSTSKSKRGAGSAVRVQSRLAEDEKNGIITENPSYILLPPLPPSAVHAASVTTGFLPNSFVWPPHGALRGVGISTRSAAPIQTAEARWGSSGTLAGSSQRDDSHGYEAARSPDINPHNSEQHRPPFEKLWTWARSSVQRSWLVRVWRGRW